MTTRADLITQINNLDIGDFTNLQIDFKALMLSYIDLGGPGFGGDKFYVDPVNGSDSNAGTGPGTAKLTLAAAYALLTDNANDTLYFIGGASSLTVADGFTWDKSYTHFIGLASALNAGGRCRLTHSADFTPIFPITGSGCQFANIHIQHGRGAVGNLVSTLLSGSRNSFINVQWEGPLHATEGGVAYRELVFANNAEANSFYNCNIGQWSIGATEALGREIEFLGFSSDTYFENCEIRCNINDAAHELVEVSAGLGAANAMCTFKNCDFVQIASGTTLTKAIEGPANGTVLLLDCKAVHITAMSGDTNVKESGSGIAS